MGTNLRFEDWEAEQIADPEFQAIAEELEPSYQVARLRLLRGLTQKQLARLVGTRQPSIARLESGREQPRLSFLRRVVKALRGRLEIRIVPEEEAVLEQGAIDTKERHMYRQAVVVNPDEQVVVGEWPSQEARIPSTTWQNRHAANPPQKRVQL